MSEPSVCCVCLTADRQRLTDRAVRCFMAQTYEPRWMLIFDSGAEPYRLPRDVAGKIAVCYDPTARGKTVGALRNIANGLAGRADIIAHWDSDDWSAPERLVVQVAAARHSGAAGFGNLLFYDSREGKKQAWEWSVVYPTRAHGTSLVYDRELWQAHTFPEHKTSGEENGNEWAVQGILGRLNGFDQRSALMIADYHGANTSWYGKTPGTPCIFDQTPAQRLENRQVKRSPDWDARVRATMEAA